MSGSLRITHHSPYLIIPHTVYFKVSVIFLEHSTKVYLGQDVISYALIIFIYVSLERLYLFY